MSGGPSRTLADWTPRIGPEAAKILDRSNRFRTYGLGFMITFAALEIWFQLSRYRLGVALSAILIVPALICFAASLRLVSATTRSAGVYLSLMPHEAKYVPLRFTSTFDMWISKRNNPKFPRVTRFD